MELALAGAHIVLLGRGVLADEGVGGGRRHQLGQVMGGGDVARVEACAVGKTGVPHAEHAGLGIHGGDEGALAPRIVAGEGGGGAVLGGHQGDVQHFGPAQTRADSQAGSRSLDAVDIGFAHGNHLIHALVGIEHHQSRHQLGDGGDRHDPVAVALGEDLPGAGIGDDEGGRTQGGVIAPLEKSLLLTGLGRGGIEKRGGEGTQADGKEQGTEQHSGKRR